MHAGECRVCVALDHSDRDWITSTARRLAPSGAWLKLGLEAFCAHGPDLVREVVAAGGPLFLDLKLHDIPNTVGRAAANCARTGVAMLNVHAAGGAEMLAAAVRGAADGAAGAPPKVLAVTLLTSLDSTALQALGLQTTVESTVVEWARLAREAGLDGVVASAREAPAVRSACGDDFLIVTPGIRPAWAGGADDQRRTVTPAEARRLGADLLVVGRPVTSADDPLAALERVMDEVRGT
jgi:orotidine-5'-phosphate decarboxylase